MLLLFKILKIHGFDLQCTFRSLDNAFVHTNRTGCHANNMNVQSRDQVVTSVNGKDLKSFSQLGYKSLEIRIQPVHFIPQGLGEFFSDLEGLAIDSSHTKEIAKSDLAQFPKLKQLYLSLSDVQSFPADLFEANPEILYIYVVNNKLTHVGRGILTPLKKLRSAYFVGNPCINMEVTVQSQMSTLVTALERDCRNDTIDELNKQNKKIVQNESISACEPLKSPTDCIDELKRKLV